LLASVCRLHMGLCVVWAHKSSVLFGGFEFESSAHLLGENESGLLSFCILQKLSHAASKPGPQNKDIFKWQKILRHSLFALLFAAGGNSSGAEEAERSRNCWMHAEKAAVFDLSSSRAKTSLLLIKCVKPELENWPTKAHCVVKFPFLPEMPVSRLVFVVM